MFAVLAGLIGLSAPCAQAASNEAAVKPRNSERSLVGVWEGTTIAICPGSIRSRCNAHQKVTITLIEGARSKLGGYYKCAYGNSNCYNMNETGKVASVNYTHGRLWIRVMMPDGTSCLFNGVVIGGNTINGGYSCSAGGGKFERGSWRAKRKY